jgi:hypothetical protein
MALGEAAGRPRVRSGVGGQAQLPQQGQQGTGHPPGGVGRRGVHQSAVALENDVRTWINNRNQDPKPFDWTKTAEDIF